MSRKKSPKTNNVWHAPLGAVFSRSPGTLFVFFFVLLVGILVGVILNSRTSAVRTNAQSGSTKVLVEAHSFVGSGKDSNGRYDGWFAVILDDGTPLVDWIQTDFYGPVAVQIPDGHIAFMHWQTEKNGSEEPYVIDPERCGQEGDRATTTDYRDIHYNVPETPRAAGRRSVEAFCAESHNGSSSGTSPSPFITIIPGDDSSPPGDINIDILLEGCEENGTCTILQGAGGIIIIIIIILVLRAIT